MTVYGVDAYSETDLLEDPDGVIDRIPRVVCQFVVYPKRSPLSDSENGTDVDP